MKASLRINYFNDFLDQLFDLYVVIFISGTGK